MSVNLHCFQYPERELWRIIASGGSLRPHPRLPGRKIEQVYTDSGRKIDKENGYAMRRGGILFPVETDLDCHRWYYRFIGTAAYSQALAKSGVEGAVFGGWWIESGTMRQIVQFAREHGDSLCDAAAYYLALPDEWGDRGRLARVMPKSSIRAWRGNGKPAQMPSGTRIPPQHLKEIYQLFLPGDSALRAKAFNPVTAGKDIIYTRDFDLCGWFV